VKADELYCDGDLIDKVSSWNHYDLMVLKVD